MNVWKPTLAIMCCHVLTGTASVITRYLVSVLDPVEIAFMRYLFGGFAMLPLFFIFRSSKLTQPLFFKTMVLGALFFGLFPFMFSWSLVHTTAARGSLVLATMPILTMLISNAIGHERINKFSLMAIVFTFCGLAVALSDKLMMLADNNALFKGEFIMLLAALIGAVYTIFSRKVVQKIPASTMTPIAMLSGCVCLFPFSWANGITEHLVLLTSTQMALMVYLGIIAGGVAFFLLNWVLNKSTATFASLFVTLNPITAIILGYLFLGESIKLNFIVGVVVVFIGLGFAVKSQANATQAYGN